MVGDGGGESDSVYEADEECGEDGDEELSFGSSILIGVMNGLDLPSFRICDRRGVAELPGFPAILACSV
jgi:hypothetical protein